ncbi:MAG: hypothetical protein AB7G88_00905, partial [Thermomicrobiales bacterium]
FVARCRLSSTDVPVSRIFSEIAPSDVWGVLIETQFLPGDSREVAVVDDFGNEHAASIGPGDLLGGDPQSLFMASRYWELEPSYIQQLRAILQSTGLETADEEPRDDGALNDPAAPAP